MSKFLYQIRVDVTKALAEELKNKNYSEDIADMVNNLKSKNATLVCQYDAFKGFLDECDNNNQQGTVLYKWTKDTVNDKEKKEKYKKSFTVYIGQEQLYKKELAEIILKDIKNVNNKSILKVRIIDSNPANNPQPPKKHF